MELKPLHFYARIAAQKCCLKGDLSYFESLTQAEAFISSSSMDDRIEKVIGEKYKTESFKRREGDDVKFYKIVDSPKGIGPLEQTKEEYQLDDNQELDGLS